MKITTITLSGLALFAGLSLMSCNNDKATGAAESAASSATEAMDKAGDKMTDAANGAADAMNNAGDKMTDAAAGAMDKAGDKVSDAANAAAGAMDKAGNKMTEVANRTGEKVRFGVRDANFKLTDETSGLHQKMVAAASNLDIRMKVLEEKMQTTAAAGEGKAEMQEQYDILKEMGEKLQSSFDQLASLKDGDMKKFERKTKVFLKTIDPTL